MLFKLLPLCHTSFKRTCFLLIGLSLFINLSGLAQKPQPATLPAPYATKSTMNFSNVHGWENGQTPKAPEGFTVSRFADKLDNPRLMYVTPNGDILVTESNTNHTLVDKIGGKVIGTSKSNNQSYYIASKH